MAKAAKKTTEEPIEDVAPADVIPAPLAAVVEEQDTVLQAHFTRQANHEKDLAPSLAKQAREDQEREEQLRQAEGIAASWRKHVAEQERLQKENDERENAAANAIALRQEIEAHRAAIAEKTAEAERLEKLAKKEA